MRPKCADPEAKGNEKYLAIHAAARELEGVVKYPNTGMTLIQNSFAEHGTWDIEYFWEYQELTRSDEIAQRIQTILEKHFTFDYHLEDTEGALITIIAELL